MTDEIKLLREKVFKFTLSKIVRFVQAFFQIRSHQEGGGKYRDLIKEISTLVKTAL